MKKKEVSIGFIIGAIILLFGAVVVVHMIRGYGWESIAESFVWWILALPVYSYTWTMVEEYMENKK